MDLNFNFTGPNAEMRKRGWYLFGAFLVAALALPLVTDNQFVVRLTMFAFIWSAFSLAWNLFSGYSGYISFGHAVFFGIGAFVSTVLQINFHITPWIGMIAGAVAAVVLAVLVGYATFKAGLTGIYFGISMLAFVLIAGPVIIWLGYLELSIPIEATSPILYMSFRGVQGYYYTAMLLFAISFVVSWWVKRNRLGYYLQAIKASEEAAESLGVNTLKYKIYALSLSAFLSALIGTLYVQSNYIFATSGIFSLHLSAEPVILSVAGGMGTLFGPIVAAFTLFPFAELLREQFGSIIPGIDSIVYGSVLIVVIIFYPDGLYVGIRRRLLDRGDTENSETANENNSDTTEVSD